MAYVWEFYVTSATSSPLQDLVANVYNSNDEIIRTITSWGKITSEGKIYWTSTASTGAYIIFQSTGFNNYRWNAQNDGTYEILMQPLQYIKEIESRGTVYLIKDEEARNSIETLSGEIVTELSGLSDVSISSPTQGENLTYDSTLGKWKNTATSATVAWGGITGTLSDQTDLKNALDDKANKFSVTNPQLTSTDGICTWTITNTIGSKNVQVDVQEVSTGKFVLCNVDSSSSLIHVYLIGDSTIPSGTYEATIIG